MTLFHYWYFQIHVKLLSPEFISIRPKLSFYALRGQCLYRFQHCWPKREFRWWLFISQINFRPLQIKWLYHLMLASSLRGFLSLSFLCFNTFTNTEIFYKHLAVIYKMKIKKNIENIALPYLLKYFRWKIFHKRKWDLEFSKGLCSKGWKELIEKIIFNNLPAKVVAV